MRRTVVTAELERLEHPLNLERETSLVIIDHLSL